MGHGQQLKRTDLIAFATNDEFFVFEQGDEDCKGASCDCVLALNWGDAGSIHGKFEGIQANSRPCVALFLTMCLE